MSEKCFVEHCTEYPMSHCRCLVPPVYFCSAHLACHPLAYPLHHEIVTHAEPISLSRFAPLAREIQTYITGLYSTESSLIRLSSQIIQKIKAECNKSLKKISSTRETLLKFLFQTQKFSIVDLEKQKLVKSLLKENFKNSEKKLRKLLSSTEKTLSNYKNKETQIIEEINKNKKVCQECKTGYINMCNQHLLCETCKLCFCPLCKVSTNYPNQDQKGQKLNIEKEPVRSLCDPDNNICTYIYKGFNFTLNLPVSVTKIVGKSQKHSTYNFNILKFLSRKLPSFLWFNGSNIEQNEVVIVTEYAVDSLSEKTHEQFSLETCQKIAKGLIEAFTFMSFYKIFHRNICLDCILLTEDLTPKIYDFSLATLHSTDWNSNKFSDETLAQGKDGFLSPERKTFIQNWKKREKVEFYNIEKSDVFSLGLVLLCLFCNFKPVYDLQSCETWDEVKHETKAIKNKFFRSLVKRMLHPVPAARPYFREVLEEFYAISF